MCRPHREGDPVVGELDEPGELFVIQGRVRSEDANRRPGSRLRTLEVFLGDVGHLAKSFAVPADGSANRPVLEWVVDVAVAVGHDAGLDCPGADERYTSGK